MRSRSSSGRTRMCMTGAGRLRSENPAPTLSSQIPSFLGLIMQAPAPTPKDAIEIIFRPDPNVYDGRWSNVGWLQELPKPVTNLSWDNAALVSGATLSKLGLEEDDIVELSVNGRKINAPVLVVP